MPQGKGSLKLCSVGPFLMVKLEMESEGKGKLKACRNEVNRGRVDNILDF